MYSVPTKMNARLGRILGLVGSASSTRTKIAFRERDRIHALLDEHFMSGSTEQWGFHLSEKPPRLRRGVPRSGQHTDDILGARAVESEEERAVEAGSG